MLKKFSRIGHASALLALSSALVISCGDDPPPVETPKPKIGTFTANPATVPANGTTTLTWAVTDATSVKIDIMGGANVQPSTTMLSGTVMTPALAVTTTFVLTAVNQDQITTKTLQVVVESAPPMHAMITTFSASPTSVNPGESSTLSWATANAVSGVIRVAGTEITTIDPSMLANGTYQADNITAATTYTLAVKGEDMQEVTLDVTVQLNGPSITSFTAMPDTITRGDTATLAWVVTNATNVTVTGNGASGEVYNGANATGSVMVTPDATETFTLVATGAGNQMATQNVTITVNAPQGATITSFTASPSAVDIGVPSTLAWDVVNATGGIEISSGGSVLHTDAAAMGSFVVTPIATTVYDLRAINMNGDAMQSVTVTVNPTAPVITSFTATPTLLGVNGSVTLDWITLGAMSIDIEANGTNVYNTTTNTAMGTTSVTVTDLVTNFTLIATNANGNNTFSVRVVAHPMPVINTFTVAPNAVPTNDPVTITWDVSNANELALNANGTPVMTFPVVSTGTTAGSHAGSLTLNLTVPTVFELVARSAAGEVRRTVNAATLVAETEPNDDFMTAFPLPGDGSGVNGTLTAGDQDWYSVNVVQGGHVIIETSDGAGGCPMGMDTVVTFLASDGTTEITSNDDIGGGNFCSRIDGRVNALARNLVAGTYYIKVVHFSSTGVGDYTLTVTAGAPACGNAVLDLLGMVAEQCDDGNTTANDGCSATCTAEAQGTVMGPPAETTFSGALDPGTQVDFYQVTMAAEGYIRVETFAPASPSCTGADTTVRLYDSAFVELGSDEDDGVSLCSLINPLVDTFSHVQAGTYWVGVSSRALATLSAYSVVIRALPFGCGNGITEGTEQCDDGNNVTGDGCDVSCLFEGTSENEAGGNNTFDGMGVITITADTLFSGAIVPIADVDVYGVTVPDGYHLDAFVTVNSLSACPVGGPRGQLQLLDTNGTTQLASNSTGGPDANCGRIAPATTTEAFEMAAGTYFLRVREVGDDAEIATYYLHIAIVAPGCGNGVLEGTEFCDDGNATAGDGCSPMCSIEPLGVLMGLGPQTFPGSIDAIGELDYYQIDVTGPSYIDAATWESAAAGTCAFPLDTVIRLYDANFVQLGEDDEDGLNSCSHFGPLDAFARVEAGTYYVSVEDWLNNALIPAYELVLEAIPADVCGNGFGETGEVCDDGNTTAGDGCSPTCQLEINPTIVTAPGGTVTVNLPAQGSFATIEVHTASNGQAITVSATDTGGACDVVQTAINFGNDAFELLGQSLGNGVVGVAGTCAAIRYPQEAYAANLLAGTYYVLVFAQNGATGSVDVTVGVVSSVCGNSFIDGNAGETCDDGNTTAGDGCDATCHAETAIMLPDVPQVLPGSLAVAEVERYALDVTAEMYLRAETFAPDQAAGCTGGVDTVIRLYNATNTQLGNDDEDGINSCSLINPATDTWAHLMPGMYAITVEDYLLNTAIAAYTLVLTSIPANQCGNGIVEGMEACDDGNTTALDGCSAMCTDEAQYLTEVEPNDTDVDATDLGTVPAILDFAAALPTVTDEDWWQFTLAAPANISIATYGTLGAINSTCPPGGMFGGDTTLWLYNGVPSDLTATSPLDDPTIVEFDDDDNFGFCSRIPGTNTAPAVLNIPAGSYYIRIKGYPPDSTAGDTLPAYRVRIAISP